MVKSVATFLFFMTLMLFGCSSQRTPNQSSQTADQLKEEPQQQEMKTTRLHIDGFMKSKSGAI